MLIAQAILLQTVNSKSTSNLINDLILANGGAYWDASDITTLFQNTAGTTPVTAAGQTVRCIKDKGNGGWHLTNSVGDLYQVDEFGKGYVDFSGATGQLWTTTSSTTAFNFLFNATGGSLITMIEKGPDTTARTFFRNTATFNGVEWRMTTSGVPQITIQGAAAALVQEISLNVAPFGPGARRANMYTLDESGLKQYCDITTPFASKANTGTPSPNNGGQSLFISSSFKCKFFSSIAIGKVLSSSEWSSIAGYLNSVHGRPVPQWTTPFALGGQSNMEASNSIDGNAELPNVNVGMYDKSDKLRVANEPIHDRTNWIPTTEAGGTPNSHSSALKFAKDIFTNSAIKPIIVPGAIGGTSMSQWMPTVNRVDRATLYGSLNARLIALNNIQSNTPVFVWFGHEADTALTSENLATGTLNTAYQEAFYNLFMQWRSDYPNSPIIFCQLSANNTATAQKRRAMEAIRRCEASYGGTYAIPNSYMVVTHDVKRNASPDDVHISLEGQIEVGRRIALAYRGGVLGESINWEGPRLVSITKPSSNTVLVKFTRTINDNLSNFGTLFRVYSDGVENTVNSAVRDSDDTAVLLTLSANHSGVVVVTYGERNTANNAVRANVVVDSDGLPAPVFGPVVAE